MSAWFKLTERLAWTDSFPPEAREIPYRYAHLGGSFSPIACLDFGPDLIDRTPCDAGPPCLCRDVQLFAVWVEQRRLGPDKGAGLALALFGGQPEPRLDTAFSAPEWNEAVDRCVQAAATLCLAVGDSPMGLDISVPLTMDLVWFLARSALVLRWMDFDRYRRLDTTNALPLMPACLEVCRMATRRIAKGEGVATKVAETLIDLIFIAQQDYVDDNCPVRRAARTALIAEPADEQDAESAERSAPPFPL